MFGVLGWMIMIVESLIAAPVWAASHVIPEGEGFAGNAARQGWMLLLNILFRPILLVLGLFFSMLMMYFISQLALSGYTMYHSSVALSVGTTTGFFAFVFGNIILIGLIVALSHKSHEMIYETADNVMRWVGSNTKPLGEAQGEATVSRTYAGAAGYVGQGTNAAMAKGGGGGAGGTKPKGGDEDDADKKGKGEDATPAGGSEAGGRSGSPDAASPGAAVKGNVDSGKSSGVNGGGSQGGSGGEANGASESGGRKGKEEL
jgi:hypothetical protein